MTLFIIGEKKIKNISYDLKLIIINNGEPEESRIFRYNSKNSDKGKILESATTKTSEFLLQIENAGLDILPSNICNIPIKNITYSITLTIEFVQQTLQKIVNKRNCKDCDKILVLESAQRNVLELLTMINNL
jgi:hypothetical protein